MTMHIHRIGGELSLDALRQLHQPAHERSLIDARDYLKRACAALAATEHPSPNQAAELGRLHSQLRDVLCGLETLGRRL